MTDLSYGFSATLRGVKVDEVLRRVTEALKGEGFGVLTTIDLQDAFKKKLDIDYRPYVILGACNPHLARKALETDPNIGLLLPCNVVVQEPAEGTVILSVADPGAMFALVPGPSLKPIAAEARERLVRAFDMVRSQESGSA